MSVPGTLRRAMDDSVLGGLDPFLDQAVDVDASHSGADDRGGRDGSHPRASLAWGLSVRRELDRAG